MKGTSRKVCVVGVVVVWLGLLTFVWGLEEGQCGGDCLCSKDCAVGAGDDNCRCSYFHCRTIPAGDCGGGCVTDNQCQEWPGGDERCKCGDLFECMYKKAADSPAYKVFAKFMLSARGAAYQGKVEEMQRRYQHQLDTEKLITSTKLSPPVLL